VAGTKTKERDKRKGKGQREERDEYQTKEGGDLDSFSP
jgi:hypothetical protein